MDLDLGFGRHLVRSQSVGLDSVSQPSPSHRIDALTLSTSTLTRRATASGEYCEGYRYNINLREGTQSTSAC